MTWLAGLPSKLWGYLAAALAGLALLLTARAGWRRAGRAEAERDALGRDLWRAGERANADADAARAADPAGELRQRWQRD